MKISNSQIATVLIGFQKEPFSGGLDSLAAILNYCQEFVQKNNLNLFATPTFVISSTGVETGLALNLVRDLTSCHYQPLREQIFELAELLINNLKLPSAIVIFGDQTYLLEKEGSVSTSEITIKKTPPDKLIYEE